MAKDPLCLDCKVQLYGDWEDRTPLCRGCRLKRNPMTKERALKIFADKEQITDGVNWFWMSKNTGMIRGSCYEGSHCCNFEYATAEEFFASHKLDDFEAATDE